MSYTTTTPAGSEVSTPAVAARRKPTRANGVDIEQLFATINGVKQQPQAARFQFRASNTWLNGTHSQSRCEGFSGAGGEHQHARAFSYDADHHPVLCGAGNAPAPIEYLLGALACCITAGIGNIASARGVQLHSVTASVEGDINLLGLLGLDEQVRNGYQALRVRYRISGDAPPEVLRAVVAQSQARSAVFDVLRNGVPIEIEVEAPGDAGEQHAERGASS